MRTGKTNQTGKVEQVSLGPLPLLAIVSVLYSTGLLATSSLASSSFLLWFFHGRAYGTVRLLNLDSHSIPTGAFLSSIFFGLLANLSTAPAVDRRSWYHW